MTALSPAKEAAFEKVRGLWIAIPTPFTLEGEIDEGALRKAVDYYIDGLEVDGPLRCPVGVHPRAARVLVPIEHLRRRAQREPDGQRSPCQAPEPHA